MILLATTPLIIPFRLGLCVWLNAFGNLPASPRVF